MATRKQLGQLIEPQPAPWEQATQPGQPQQKQQGAFLPGISPMGSMPGMPPPRPQMQKPQAKLTKKRFK